MTVTKPFHRTVRAMKPAQNAGYSGWAYIVDPDYAKSPEHFVRAFLLIQDDLREIFEYIEPSDVGKAAYSYRIHALLMRTCIEVEANFKAIFAENTCSRQAENMKHYRKADVSHHLSSYKVMLPIWNPAPLVICPFEPWKALRGAATPANPPGILWYRAYNASKHNRHDQFQTANLESLVAAVAGLLVLLTAQFKDQDFSPGATLLSVGGHQAMEPATGSFFRVEYPSDWAANELYDFDWSALMTQADRFQKFDYDAVPD